MQDKPDCSLNTWNTWPLTTRKELSIVGSFRPYQIPSGFERAKRVAMLKSGLVAVLSHDGDQLGLFATASDGLRPVATPALSPPAQDLCASRDHIYTISTDGEDMRCWHVDAAGAMTAAGAWCIPPNPLRPRAEIVIADGGFDLFPRSVCVGPNVDGSVLVIKLHDVRECTITTVGLAELMGTAAVEGITMCGDATASSLIVGDANSHRIAEIHLADGTIRHLCGAGGEGQAARDVDALSAPPSPSAIAVYRYADVISSRSLSNRSEEAINLDHTRVLPRALIYAEPSTGRIMRLVQFPVSPLAGRWSGLRRVFPLIGPGEANKDAPAIGRPDDLTTWCLGKPSRLAVGPAGELLIVSDEHNRMVLLTPGTSRTEVLAYRQAQRSENIES